MQKNIDVPPSRKIRLDLSGSIEDESDSVKVFGREYVVFDRGAVQGNPEVENVFQRRILIPLEDLLHLRHQRELVLYFLRVRRRGEVFKVLPAQIGESVSVNMAFYFVKLELNERIEEFNHCELRYFLTFTFSSS